MGIAVLYGSSRRQGNSDTLANQLVGGAEADQIYLSDYNLQAIDDYRHTERGAYPDDDYQMLINRILEQDVLVFATPIYWYGMSGVMKTFVDRWSQSLVEDRAHFKTKMSTKTAYVIAVGDDEPQEKGKPLIQQFQYIFDFAGVTFAGYILGKGNKPGEILQDTEAQIAVEKLRGSLHSR
ncbi:flavodoxin family protein [Paenibacillus sp. SI8]|uniref:flavodoxin family protein n=1 Tax=unclassified Paenibacillus TaxID=185978 RepID=UPI003465CA22